MRSTTARTLRTLALVLATAVGAAPSNAGSFGVAPTRIDLGKGARSSLVEVSNDDTRKLSFQVRLASWRQDAAGKDQYADSQDLIFFPPLFTVNPGEKRVIRVGLKGGDAPASEAAYRLFIEEIPEPSTAATGPEVKVILRFGVPVFTAPAAPRKSFVMDEVAAAPGKVSFRIRNDGNQSAKFEVLRILRDGAPIAEATGWYVLADAARGFEVPVEPAKCTGSGPIEVIAQAEGVTVKGALAATPALCNRP
jgi:fimbrial chaperone protein